MVKSFMMVAVLLLCSCSAPKPVNPILAALAKYPDFHIEPATKALVVIADNSCLTCNKEMAEMVTTFISKPDVQFVVSASEGTIDLEQFLQPNHKNIWYDHNHVLTSDGIVQGSTILFFNKNQEVDTMIAVDATRLEAQLKYVHDRLKE